MLADGSGKIPLFPALVTHQSPSISIQVWYAYGMGMVSLSLSLLSWSWFTLIVFSAIRTMLSIGLVFLSIVYLHQ